MTINPSQALTQEVIQLSTTREPTEASSKLNSNHRILIREIRDMEDWLDTKEIEYESDLQSHLHDPATKIQNIKSMLNK